MKYQKMFLITLMILLFTACDNFFMICSLNPFYQEKNITLIPDIEGIWTTAQTNTPADTTQSKGSVWEQLDTTSVWTIRREFSEERLKDHLNRDSSVFHPLNYYHAQLSGGTTCSVLINFKVVFFTVGKNLYADFLPLENNLNKSRLVNDSYFKIHTLAKVDRHNNQVTLSWLGSDSVKDMLENKRVRLSYRWVREAGRLLLTGPSAELTGMLERYGEEKRFIDWDTQQAKLKLNRIN